MINTATNQITRINAKVSEMHFNVALKLIKKKIKELQLEKVKLLGMVKSDEFALNAKIAKAGNFCCIVDNLKDFCSRTFTKCLKNVLESFFIHFQ